MSRAVDIRIAVIADIHGNLGALEAVLADLQLTRPDLVVNLGDCLSGPLQARDVADLLMAQGWLTVRGNHDRYLVEMPLDRLGASDKAAAEQMEPRHFDWLRTLPVSATATENGPAPSVPTTDVRSLPPALRVMSLPSNGAGNVRP